MLSQWVILSLKILKLYIFNIKIYNNNKDLYTCDVSYDLLLKHKKSTYKDKYDTSELT